MEPDPTLAFMQQITRAFAVTIRAATETSCTLAEHRAPAEAVRTVRAPDIAAGLIYRLMTPMTEAELAEQQRKIDELSDASDESDEEAMDDEREDQEEHSHRALGLSSYTCNCEVCARVRVCLVNYHAHEPVDQLAQLMKRAIDETCNVHNIHVEGATQ